MMTTSYTLKANSSETAATAQTTATLVNGGTEESFTTVAAEKESPAAAAKIEGNGESKVDNSQHEKEADVTVAAAADAAATTSVPSANNDNTVQHDEKPSSIPDNNPGPAKTQEEAVKPAQTQSILPPNPAPVDNATSVNPGSTAVAGVTNAAQSTIPATTAQTGVPTQHTPAVPVTAPVAAATPVVEATIMEKDEVSTLYVGRVIGKGGEMIRDLQARSGCQIDVDQNVPHGAPRIINYKGTPTDVAFAKQLVAMLCRDGVKDSDLPLGKAQRKIVQVPSNVIGKIIGRGGEMIRELQNRSRAKIQVDHSGAGRDENHRQVIVTGSPETVVKAEEMIHFLCVNPAMDAMQALEMLIRDKLSSGTEWGSGPPYPNLPNQGHGMTADAGMGNGMYGGGAYGQASAAYGGYNDQQAGYGIHGAQQYGSSDVGIGGIETEVVPCAKMHMGRVIGQKGVTINDLQKRSGCDIQINQQVPMGMDCQISIKGSRQGIDTAKQMIQEIIELGSQHPYAGGRKWLFCVDFIIPSHHSLTSHDLMLSTHVLQTDLEISMEVNKLINNRLTTKVVMLTKPTATLTLLSSRAITNSTECLSNSTMEHNPCTNSSPTKLPSPHMALLLPLQPRLPGEQPQVPMGKCTTTTLLPMKRVGTNLLECLKKGTWFALRKRTSEWNSILSAVPNCLVDMVD